MKQVKKVFSNTKTSNKNKQHTKIPLSQDIFKDRFPLYSGYINLDDFKSIVTKQIMPLYSAYTAKPGIQSSISRYRRRKLPCVGFLTVSKAT